MIFSFLRTTLPYSAFPARPLTTASKHVERIERTDEEFFSFSSFLRLLLRSTVHPAKIKGRMLTA